MESSCVYYAVLGFSQGTSKSEQVLSQLGAYLFYFVKDPGWGAGFI